VLYYVREVCAFVQPLHEAAVITARATMLVEPRQQPQQAVNETLNLLALFTRQLFQVQRHQEHRPVRVDVRPRQSSNLIDSHTSLIPCSSLVFG
jgi:hypothetical protein